MSATGAPRLDPGEVRDLRVVVVAAQWHEVVMAGLVAGAERACAQLGVRPRLVRVPGAFELPVVAQACARAGFEVVVALGVVIRGGTPHFEYVCDAATAGLTRVALDTGVAVGFGVLTCDDEAQALDRAGLPGSGEDKGYDATVAALATAATLRTLAGAG